MSASARTTAAARRNRANGSVRPRRLRAANDGDGALRHLVDFLGAFMWQADPNDLTLSFVTRSVVDVLGHPVAEWLGGPERWGELIHADDRARVIEELRAAGADGKDHELEFRAIASDGRIVWMRHAVRTVTSPSGHSELWGLTTDITEGKKAENALRLTTAWNRALSEEAKRYRQQALHDALTSLPNRILFDDRLNQALREAARRSSECSFLLIDLDGFKQINDSLGHQTGDAVLREVAVRLRISLRKADTLARVGGDEFAAVLPETDPEGALTMARRMTRALRDAPLVIDGASLPLRASIGIATFPAHGTDASQLLGRADEAMYRAKAGSRGYAIHNPKSRLASVARVRPERSRPDGSRSPTRVSRRWILLAAAAVLVASSWAFAAARRPEPARPAAVRLEVATHTLSDSSQGSSVAAVIATAQRTLDEVRWEEVGTEDLQRSLAQLRKRLEDVKRLVPASLRDEVQRLTTEIQRVQAAARVKDDARTTTRPRAPVP